MEPAPHTCNYDAVKNPGALIPHRFHFQGKEVEDSFLMNFAIGALGRSLVFLVESRQVLKAPLLASVAAYYSLFHFCGFMMLSCPRFLTDRTREEMDKAMDLDDDPAKKIGHRDVLPFLDKCTDPNGLLRSVRYAFDQMKELRNEMNYGPRLRLVNGKPSFGFCDQKPADVVNLVTQLEGVLRDGLRWTYATAINAREQIPMVVSGASQIFENDGERYNGCISREVALEAERLRHELEQIIPQPG